MITSEWLAGFCEGEGCFHVTSKGKQPMIMIGQKHREVLAKIQEYLTIKGIKSHLGDRQKTNHGFYLSLGGLQNCLQFCLLIQSHMNHEVKIKQLENMIYHIQNRPPRKVFSNPRKYRVQGRVIRGQFIPNE